MFLCLFGCGRVVEWLRRCSFGLASLRERIVGALRMVTQGRPARLSERPNLGLHDETSLRFSEGEPFGLPRLGCLYRGNIMGMVSFHCSPPSLRSYGVALCKGDEH
jgi:hypothetical protein